MKTQTKILSMSADEQFVEYMEFDNGDAPLWVEDLPIYRKVVPVELYSSTAIFDNELVADALFDDKRVLETLVNQDHSRFMDALVANCKTIYVAPRRITVEHDRMKGHTKVTWSNKVASPEMDFFKKLFECKQEHYEYDRHRCFKEHFDSTIHELRHPHQPTTIRGALRLTWRLLRDKLRRKK
jgi:hypothetical protein